ncbi:alcohol dehydrogenase catalytic domain-containing protein [Jannaschia seohaensis]|uniref:Threonine dehydrogenase n=1 Tax=Jannaschia seohaensis TaxID=475081 RepID=A0A2Y9C7R8_9RHOB|nr:alcohol dehydrogenase catalytic domain-containing protein [Jannaschia seohaensis]PWJ18021.1 threonine dehydrogenase-like Zn-dependent dehydrogenase [Jannaschia seohaensis]SSA46543.1 Threonine dehydrogenase [Jannaschia seohaensis]
MKALVYTGPEALEVREVPDPIAADGEVEVRVARVGICGSDMHAFLGHDERRPAPLILGHEASGLAGGRRVTVNPLVTCMTCPACLRGETNLCARRQIISMPPREGAFAGAVAMPERNLVDVPDHVTDAQAALAEPIACGWNGARSGIAAAGVADRALVLGGGAIGLGAALCLMAQGVGDVTVVEPNDMRRAFLDGHVQTAAKAPDGAFDVVVDAVGIDPTRAAASAAVRPGGAIVHIGLGGGQGGLDLRRITLQQIAFLGIYTYTAQDFRDTCAAMFDGRLGPLDWVEERPLTEGARAFADIRAGAVAAPKILLVP